MSKILELKLKELEQRKSELDLEILETKKKEYKEKIRDILKNQSELELEIEEEKSKQMTKEMILYYKKIAEIDYKIEHKDEILANIDKKIKYIEGKDKKNNEQLHRETEQGIAEIFGSDPLYQYAQETNNTEMINKLKKRSLTPDEYTKLSEKMYKDVFSPILKKKNKSNETQQTSKVALPEGMTEKIKETIKDNKEFTTEEIEKFLKKVLKKLNGEIMISHIKTKFGKRADKAIDIIKKIIAEYSEFKIVENSEKETSQKTASKKSKNEKLIATLNENPKKGKEISKYQLLKELTKIGEEVNLEKRIDNYIEIFEKLGHKFSNKEVFKEETKESIETQTSIQIEEGIVRALKKIIEGTLILRKTEAYGYRSYELGEKYYNWRILLYPNKEIMKICSHPEYDNIIDSRPPSDKRAK